jgi:hypothetical protein
LNERLGWNLPALRQDSDGQVVADQRETDNRASTATEKTSTKSSKSTREATNDRQPTSRAKSSQPSDAPLATPKSTTQTPSKTSPGPLADRLRPSAQQAANATRGSPEANGPTAADLRYGLLRDVGRDRFLSPAGLQYGPGSEEGHRLEHLKRHTKDIPNRKGSHGVFDGEMEGALKTIDLAYQRAKRGQRTTKQTDGDRTIYTVDMGKRIGFVGGETGQRKRKPMARRVRLVLDGTNVITAYPL